MFSNKKLICLAILLFSSFVVVILFITNLLLLLNYILASLFVITGLAANYVDYRQKCETTIDTSRISVWLSVKAGYINLIWAILIIVVHPFRQYSGTLGFILSLLLAVLVGIPSVFLQVFSILRLLELMMRRWK